MVLEKVSKVVVADFPKEAGFHPEDGRAGDCICRAAAGNVLYAVLLELFPDTVSGFHVHMLHAAKREVEFLEEGVVREDGQDVRKGVADA